MLGFEPRLLERDSHPITTTYARGCALQLSNVDYGLRIEIIT